jgi:hypothetical protein
MRFGFDRIANTGEQVRVPFHIGLERVFELTITIMICKWLSVIKCGKKGTRQIARQLQSKRILVVTTRQWSLIQSMNHQIVATYFIFLLVGVLSSILATARFSSHYRMFVSLQGQIQ